MMPVLICTLQCQICISPSQLFFTLPKNKDDKVEADMLTCPGLVVTSQAGELP